MSLAQLARKSLTVQAALALAAIVVVRVAVRLLRRWLGDDFLDAATASMIVTALDGLVLLAVSAVAVGLRRALHGHASQSRTEHTLSMHVDSAEAEEKIARLTSAAHKLAEETKAVAAFAPKRKRKTVIVTKPPPKRGKGGRFST